MEQKNLRGPNSRLATFKRNILRRPNKIEAEVGIGEDVAEEEMEVTIIEVEEEEEEEKGEEEEEENGEEEASESAIRILF